MQLRYSVAVASVNLRTTSCSSTDVLLTRAPAWRPHAVDLKQIDHIFVTHSHLDASRASRSWSIPWVMRAVADGPRHAGDLDILKPCVQLEVWPDFTRSSAQAPT
jgi:hypothetical protein